MIILNKNTTFVYKIDVMKIKKLLYASLLVIGLMSCVDDKYDMDKLDSTMGIDVDLVGPLAYSRIQIIDVLDIDSLGELVLNIKDDTIYLQKTDSQYLGNELIDQLKVFPTTTFDLNVPIALLNYIQPTEADVDHILKLEFPEINTNENERLDSILMGHSYIDVKIEFPKKMKEGSYLKLIFDEEELSLNPELYPDNSIEIDLMNIDEEHPIVETFIDLYGAMFKFKGNNTININCQGYVGTEEDMDISNVFEITLDCTHMKPHITFINIGNARDIVENVKEIDFDYTQDVYEFGMNLPFYDPTIYMTCHNNIGIPARYYIDYVEGICSSTGEVVKAEFGENDYISIKLNSPSYDEIKDLTREQLLNYNVDNLTKYSDLKLSRENGRTDKLFKIKVDKLRYKYRIRSEETDRSKVHFFFHDSDIETKEITKLPLWFEGNKNDPEKNFRLNRKDTIELDMDVLSQFAETEITPSSIGVLKFYYKNHLPIGVNAKAKFIDKDGNEIFLSAVKDFIIESAKVDKNSNVIDGTEPKERLRIRLSDTDIEKLFSEEIRMIIDYTLENENHVNVFLRTTDWLELKLMFHIQASLVVDPID